MMIVEHDGRLENLFLDLFFPRFDPLGDLHFLLPGQKLEVPHFFQIKADRVGGLAEVSDGLFFGFFLGFRFGLGLRALPPELRREP